MIRSWTEHDSGLFVWGSGLQGVNNVQFLAQTGRFAS